MTLGRQGKIREAAEQLEKAVELNPGSAEARDNLAKAYWVLGRKDDALREVAALKKIKPANAEAVRSWMNARNAATDPGK